MSTLPFAAESSSSVRTPVDPASSLPPSSTFRYLIITDIFAWILRGNRPLPACVQSGVDKTEREAIRSEGLDPDNPAVVTAIDFVRWPLSLLGSVNMSPANGSAQERFGIMRRGKQHHILSDNIAGLDGLEHCSSRGGPPAA